MPAKRHGKFAAAKIGAMEALTFFGAALKYFVVFVGRFGVVENFIMGFDDVRDIQQQGCGALLALIFDRITQ